MLYDSFSNFTPNINKTPNLLILEKGFRIRDMSVLVDTDLTLKLFTITDSQIGSDITLTSTPSIEIKPSGSNLYYYVRLDTEDYTETKIIAKWYAKINGENFDPYPTTTFHTLAKTTEQLLLATELKDITLRRLGWPKAAVELEESHLDDSIQSAINLFNRYCSKYEYGNIDLVCNQYEYDIDDCGKGVVDVQFKNKYSPTTSTHPFWGSYFPIQDPIKFDEFVLGIPQLGVIKRVTGTDPIWKWDPNEPLKLYIDTSGYTEYYITYVYMRDHRIEEISTSYHELIKDLAECEAKFKLGEVRSKYGDGIQSHTGKITLNGETLKQEATTRKAELILDLERMQMPLPPTYF